MGDLVVKNKFSFLIPWSPLSNRPGKHTEPRSWCYECTEVGMIAIPNVSYHLVNGNNVVNSWVRRDISWQICMNCNRFHWCYWLTNVKNYNICNDNEKGRCGSPELCLILAFQNDIVVNGWPLTLLSLRCSLNGYQGKNSILYFSQRFTSKNGWHKIIPFSYLDFFRFSLQWRLIFMNINSQC